MRVVINLIAGIIFGAGLILAGMTDPAKVLNFLDFAGTWDPSLAFVMAGAIAVTATGYVLAQRRVSPILEDAFQLPPTLPIDANLFSGAALFGAGWGLGGLCPGPAITSLVLAVPGTLVFVAAMLASIVCATYLKRRQHDT